jgi:hypothetical protein
VAGLASLGLGATPANALTPPCSFGTNTSDPACQLGVPYDSTPASDKQITLISGPTVGSGTIDFDCIACAQRLSKVDVDFDPDLVGGVGGTSGKLDYKIDIFQGPLTFRSVELNVSSVFGNPTVTKEIFSDDTFATASLLQTLTITGNGRTGFVDLPSGYQTLWVRDSYFVPEGDTLESFANTYTQAVPGPLPLLGAGTAFGFSRRLRRRVRQRHSLG